MADACVVGVDLGGTKLLAGSVDANLNVHHRARRIVQGADQAALLEHVRDAVEEVAAATSLPVAAAGIGIPSLLDRRTGEAGATVHLDLAGVPVGAVMEERLGIPVVLENDANCAAVAEHRYGAARGADEVVLLTIGTGVGGGLILGGELYRGAVGAAGELGHMVVDMDGAPCTCGNRGCLEVAVSGVALALEAERLAREHPGSALGRALAGGREITGPLATELAHDGDTAAREAVARIGRRLGVGIASLVNALDPEVVVVGGGVIAAGDMLLAPAREEVARRALPPSRDVARVVPAHFGDEAGMLGAAALALDELGRRPGYETRAQA